MRFRYLCSIYCGEDQDFEIAEETTAVVVDFIHADRRAALWQATRA
jgi:hypothetical protein